MARFLTIALLFAALAGCGTSQSGTLADSGYDQEEMDAAISRARREVDSFISEMDSPIGSKYSVKVAIEDRGKVEHFWLSNITLKEGEFRGTIDNEPAVVRNVRMGQSWAVRKNEISDWTYIKHGKMHGNYTLRVLLKGMPEDQANKLRATFAGLY